MGCEEGGGRREDPVKIETMPSVAARRSLPWWLCGPLAASAATGLGRVLQMNATGAAGMFVLAVLGAALLGGVRGGLLASVLAFTGLNYFFTDPRGTFRVEKTEDLVALFVFLVVSLVASGLFSRVVAERRRAERRELETVHLYALAQVLLAGAPLERVLAEVAEALVDVFGFDRAELRILDEAGERVLAEAGPPSDRPPTVLPIGDGLGSAALVPKEGGSLAEETRSLVEAFLSQAALALERARLDEEARRARLDSEASQIRAALFSAVTHDLKTPLSSIKAAVTSLLDPHAALPREDVESLLETILTESDRLNRLLGNLLDLARLQTGALEPAPVAADLPEILGVVLERMRPALQGHTVEVALKDGLPEVSADVVQLDQVLTNLLENAARFSAPGMRIRISAHRWHDVIEVRVADRGPGIPSGERERVFEPFYRKDRGEARGGTGLGLAIARAIVVAHGGRMWIEETPGEGTTVCFSLPLSRRA